MAPNVPADQRDDSLSCWAWSGGKDGSVELDRDRGPPSPPPPLQTPPSPLTPVTANNVIANTNPKSLKRQTAIVNHKTAAAGKASAASSPSSKRLKVDLCASPKTGLSNNNNNNNNNNNSVKSSASLCAALRQQPQRCCAPILSHQKAACAKPSKGCGGDNKGRSLGSAAALQTDAVAQQKGQQQGKITEYFKAQMKPVNGAKKDLASKTGSPEFRSPASHMLCRKGATDVKTDNNSSAELDIYFNINSGTQPAATVPLSKVPDLKDVAGSNLSAATPAQILSWNAKCDTDTNNRSLKAAQKINDKKNGVTLSSPSRKLQLTGPTPVLKIPDIKKNGLISSSLSSQKINALLSSSSSTSKNASSPSASSRHLPEIVSCSSQGSSSDTGEVVCSVPKPVSSETSDTSIEKESITASTPVSKLKPASEDTTACSMEIQSESAGSLTSDSGLSVSVSSSSPVPSSLPSPILSVPRTIRFPPVHCNASSVSKSAAIDQTDSIICRWSECEDHFESSTVLMEHLQAKHIAPQVMCETFVCLWVGCKVYGRTSCSRSWLERHVMSHGGNKPFLCIVQGCGQRFSSQLILERHVNSHFNQTEGSNSSTGTRRSMETTNKLFRRNGKRLRYRRQPWSARMFDYFDSGIMEGLQHKLMSMTQNRTQGEVATAPGNTISLHSRVLGRRVEPSGKIKVLLRWYPEDIVDDEWVLEKEVRHTQTVPLNQRSSTTVDPLRVALFSSPNFNFASPRTSSSAPATVTSSSASSTANTSSTSTGTASAATATSSRRRPRKLGKSTS